MSAGGNGQSAGRREAAAAFRAPLPHTAEVVVVGGGASGCSIAHQLAKRGVDVLLLEAGDLAQGASGRNGRLIDSGDARAWSCS
jgi:glycerol-3-phosphate dehydrogenase